MTQRSAAAPRSSSENWRAAESSRCRRSSNAPSRISTSSRRRAPRSSATTRLRLCIGRAEGTLLWRTRSTPTVGAHRGRPGGLQRAVIRRGIVDGGKRAADPNRSCCTFRGSVAALDMANGRTLWKSYTVLEEPVPTRKNSAGIQNSVRPERRSPPPDHRRQTQCPVCLNGEFGERLGAVLDGCHRLLRTRGRQAALGQAIVRADAGAVGSSFMSSPVLRTLATGNQVLMAGQKSGVIYGLNPDHGGEVCADASCRPGGRCERRRAGLAVGAEYRRHCVGPGRGPPQSLCRRVGPAAQPANPREFDGPRHDDRRRALAHASPTPACAWKDRPAPRPVQAVTVMPAARSPDRWTDTFAPTRPSTARSCGLRHGEGISNQKRRQGGRRSAGPWRSDIVNGTVYVNSGNALLAFSVDGK